MFSDFKSRDFELEDSQAGLADRLNAPGTDYDPVHALVRLGLAR